MLYFDVSSFGAQIQRILLDRRFQNARSGIGVFPEILSKIPHFLLLDKKQLTKGYVQGGNKMLHFANIVVQVRGVFPE